MKAKMRKFIKWFVMADAHTMDGNSIDFKLSAHEVGMLEDQISICKMEDRDNWGNYGITLNSSNVISIDYTSVLKNKKQTNCAIVTVLYEYIDTEVKYTFHRLYYEDTLDDYMEQIFVLSTGHVTKEDAKVLEEAAGALVLDTLTVHNYDDHGWIIVMPEDVAVARSAIGTLFSDAFWNILKEVRFRYPECNRIGFYCDGDTVDEFPLFEW